MMKLLLTCDWCCERRGRESASVLGHAYGPADAGGGGESARTSFHPARHPARRERKPTRTKESNRRERTREDDREPEAAHGRRTRGRTRWQERASHSRTETDRRHARGLIIDLQADRRSWAALQRASPDALDEEATRPRPRPLPRRRSAAAPPSSSCCRLLETTCESQRARTRCARRRHPTLGARRREGPCGRVSV